MSDPLPTILKVFSTTATCISAPWLLVNIDINITNDDWICKCDNKALFNPNMILLPACYLAFGIGGSCCFSKQFRFLLLCYGVNMYAADGKVPVLNHPCEPEIFPEPIAIQRSTTSPHQLL
ncbi:hypothetical protein [Aeromonas veronii]|uniref:hypothetical protein n=1 Tax=Aeromonas veronii TaxID=654 RepID=UPI003D1B23A0